ncbi:MAG: flagellin [Dinoroseobacter sp.]|nr:flagellin [Dinoroseobacter sp.]
MSSILTNNSAMVALQTLKSINTNLEKTQAEIATGKSIGSSKDSSAIWAISKVMEADVKGFTAISESLSLGESTVAVARKASETVTSLLTEIKGKVVAAQQDNVDRSKIQTEITALSDQINSVVDAAQFNGLNLLDGSVTGTNANSQIGVNVLASLNRDSNGSVSSTQIGVDAQNLSRTGGTTLGAAAVAVGVDTGTAGVIDQFNGAGTTDEIELDTFQFLDASGGATNGTALRSTTAGLDSTLTTGLMVGDQVNLTVGNVTGQYVIQEGDTDASIASGLKNGLNSEGLNSDDFTLDISTDGVLKISNNTNSDVAYSVSATRGSGGLSGLSSLSVLTSNDASNALTNIESMIQTAVDASASFGSAQARIEIQADFVSDLSDALKSGIGSLVDADMEEASARLQALQVQQQLGIQALSIANQAPQSVLSLFR